MSHPAPDCLYVWLSPFLKESFDDVDEICDQAWADCKWDGFNGPLVKRIRGRR